MPRPKVMNPEAAEKRIKYSLNHNLSRPITPEDLDLAEKLDPNIRRKVENRMQGKQQERQKTQIKSNPVSPSPVPNNSPTSPSPVKLDVQGSGSNQVGEEKIRLNKKQKEYQEFVEKRLGPFVVLLLFLFIFRGDEEKSEFYAPNREECKALAPHVARIAPKIEEWLHVPQHVHDMLVTSDDSFSLLLVVVGYLKRTGLLGNMIPGFVGRMYRKVEQPDGVDIQQDAGINGAGSNGHQPVSPDEWAVYGIGAQYQ